jgi:hypothetical protein
LNLIDTELPDALLNTLFCVSLPNLRMVGLFMDISPSLVNPLRSFIR